MATFQPLPPVAVQKPSFVAYEIDGGLDLITSLTHASPGTLVNCQNYEVARQRGVRRIDGYEKFDGGISPSYISVMLPTLTGTISGTPGVYFHQGDEFQVHVGDDAFLAVVTRSANSYDGGTGISTIDFSYVYTSINNPRLGAITSMTTQDGGFLHFPSDITLTLAASSTAAEDIAGRASNYNTVSATIQEVPGQGNVSGLFYLKDTVYATRDMTGVAISSVTNIPNIQDVLYQGTDFANATWTGVLAKIDAAGNYMAFNTTGTLSAATVKNATQSDITVGTAATTAVPSTAGAMYKAVGTRGSTIADASWQWCDLGWTVPFQDGGIGGQDFLDMNLALDNADVAAVADSTAWRTGGAVVNGATWTAGGGAGSVLAGLSSGTGVGDTSYAKYSGASLGAATLGGPLTLTDFGFTEADIPLTATITGFEVQINCGAVTHGTTGTLALTDNSLALVGIKDGVNHNFALPGTPWTSVVSPTATDYDNRSYGGTQSLLGYNNATQSDITATTFGLRYNFAFANANPITQTSSNYIEGRINNVQMRVWYVPQTNAIYFWNGSTAVKAVVTQHYIESGTITATNAKGTLYFQFVQADGTMGGQPSRPIGGAEEIYVYPANGASPDAATDKQLGSTSAAPAMNVMDWSSLIAAPPLQDGTSAPAAKYESITKNFYASSGYDAIYGVSGAGPAFYYDGTNFARILTGLTGVLESPRHIAEHQGHLVLGYYSGIVEWSNTDNVLTFNPTLGNKDAGGEGFSEHIAGIKSLNGDALAIWTKSQLKMIQGQLDNPSSVYASTISPTSGGIEYTIQPMQSWMYADFHGVTSIGATQKYGDFEIGHISSPVTPFLSPRLQLSSQFEGGNIGSINSILARNKSQYRLFFADGMALTTTFLVDGEPPQFTIQKYFASDSTTPLTWDVLLACAESTGRDHIYGATADGTGWVYELDRGNSFNGGAIPAYVTVAGNDLQAPYDRKMFYDVGVHGVAQDYATFTMSRSADYTVPTNAVALPMTYGSLTAVPTGEVSTFVSFNAIQMEGRSINLRFDSSSNNQFPHTLQSIVMSAKALDDKRT